MTREAKLRFEAKSPAHLLTHLPMNNYCDICQSGKLRQKPARRRRKDAELQGRPDEWGHTLLADHISTGDLGLSVDDDEYGLVMLDVGADICDVLASGTKNTTSVHHATKEFGSAVTWIYFFSDGAKELKKAATDLGSTVHLSSTPYRPESNGTIERRVGVISDGVRCLLGQSGLPHGWWTYVCCAGILPQAQRPQELRRHVPLAQALWTALAGQGQLCLRATGALQEATSLQGGAADQKFAPRGSQGVFVG